MSWVALMISSLFIVTPLFRQARYG
jgi:hypothetical protein